MNPVIFAGFAAIAFGLWTVFHKLAAPHINQVFGAILVSFVAVIAGGVYFLTQARGVQLVTDSKGITFLVLAGACAFFIDFFALHAYAKGLPLSIGGPIIIGGSIAIAILVGLFFGDQMSLIKLVGLALILTGAVVLAMAN